MRKYLLVLALFIPALGQAQGAGSRSWSAQLPVSLGQKAAAGSLSCVLASDALGTAAGSPTFVRLTNGTSAVGVDSGAAATYTENQPTTGSQAAMSYKGLATLTASASVKASAGNVYGVFAVNGAASVCWLECVNSATAGTLGTAVIFSAPIPASGILSLPPSTHALGNFSTGIACGIASAVDGASACGTAGNVSIFYK